MPAPILFIGMLLPLMPSMKPGLTLSCLSPPLIISSCLSYSACASFFAAAWAAF